MIDIYLREHRAPELEPRLKLEQQVIARLPDNYPYTRAQALDMARAAIPGLDEAGFAELELSADIAYVYIDGQRRYFAEFLPSLLKLRPDVAALAGRAPDTYKPLLDEAISLMRARGELGYRLHMRARLQVCDEAFTPGTYRAHLPLPAQAAQQSRLKLLSASSGLVCVADARADARTAYFERRLDVNAPFEVEYEFDNRVRYFDADRPMPEMPLYPDVPAPNADDLAELPGHIMFTPYLRALASRIVGDADAPLERAWRIYDYVTGHVRYSYMREYFLLPPIAEYAALGLKGDCGVQALLFITLCRIAGVPARWQSGMYAAPATWVRMTGRSFTRRGGAGCLPTAHLAARRGARAMRNAGSSTLATWTRTAWWPTRAFRRRSGRPCSSDAMTRMTISRANARARPDCFAPTSCARRARSLRLSGSTEPTIAIWRRFR